MIPDEIRNAILSALYEIHNRARSRASQLVGIRDLAKEVKTEFPKVKENQVAANVTFLVQNGFVEEIAVENFFAKGQLSNSKPSYKYRLSREGLGVFEHDSKFDRSNVWAGIGDINGNSNYIIIGNQGQISNLTSTLYQDGHQQAEDLRRRANSLGELTDAQKIEVQSDIEVIKAQLAKQRPDIGILSRAKENLSFLKDISALAPLAKTLFNWLKDKFNI